MKTKKLCLTTSAVLLLLAGCTETSDLEELTASHQTPVRLTAETVTVATRAGVAVNDGNMVEGAKVGVSIRPTGSGDYTNYYQYTVVDGGGMTPPATPPYYPTTNDGAIDIVAYSPYVDGQSFTGVSLDQTTDANYRASDLLWVKKTNQGRTSSAVALQFSHKMAKLEVTATAGAGVAQIRSISMQRVKNGCTFEPVSGTVTVSGSAGTINFYANGTATTASAACVFPSQEISTGSLLTIVTDLGTATYSLGTAKTFAAGNKYVMNITVNRTEVGSTTTITNWGESGIVSILPFEGNMLPKFVDLGLPSGTLWADRNIGAASIYDYGYYFAWGETTNYVLNAGGDDALALGIRNGSANTKTTYQHDCSNTRFYTGNGTTHSWSKYGTAQAGVGLDNADDAAYVNWGMHMPSKEQFEELVNSSYTTVEKRFEGEGGLYNGKPGMLVKGKGAYSGNSVFFPAMGYRNSTRFYYVGTLCVYWSRTLSVSDASYAYRLRLEKGFDLVTSGAIRSSGFPIRAVNKK